MGIPMLLLSMNPKHPRFAGVDLLKVFDVMKYAPHLRQHGDIPADTRGKIDEGLKACQEYVLDPEGVPDATFETMTRFVMEYSEKRMQFCNSNVNEFTVRVVNDAYQIAKIREAPFSGHSPFTLKDLEDYGDYSPIIAQGFRCKFCFGHHYFNKANHNTGVQFQWVEIARALKRREKSRLPAYLWEELPAVDKNVTPDEECVDELLADSFLEASKATGADQDAMVWQVVKYADQERHPGPKELIRSEAWDRLASHTHSARAMLDAMWRGPVCLSDRHREAARTMAIAVALVQRTWFVTISPEGESQRSEYDDRQYSGPMQWERGELPHTMISPGVKLLDPTLLHDPRHESICAVDIRVPNAGTDDLAAERWIGDMSLFDTDQASYSLPPQERITQRRVEVLQTILSAGAINGEDWRDRWRCDLGITSLMALRYPMMYSDRFLLNIINIAAGDPNAQADGQLLKDFIRLPSRGLVSSDEFDGLFGPETVFDKFETHQNRIEEAILRLRKFRYEEVESFLDGEPVDESLILWDNRGASTIINTMNAIDRIPENPSINEDEFQAFDIVWTDLSIALRRATDSPTAATYTFEFCDKLIQLAGLPLEELQEEGWSRYQGAGILPLQTESSQN
jgi:hypothetical protein